MGTMIIFYLIYPLLMLLQRCLQRCRYCCRCAKKNSRNLYDTLYFPLLLTTVFESYSLIALSCLIAIPVLSFDSWGLSVQSAACLTFMVSFLTLPFALLLYLAIKMDLLSEDGIKRRFGKLYEDLHLQNGKKVFLWPAFFLIRRSILAISVVLVPSLIGQFYLFWLQCIIAAIILGYARPFVDKARYKMEFYNETTMMLVLTTMLCFTPWLQNVELKTNIGFVACGLVVIHLLVNLIIMTCSSCRNLTRKIKLCKFRRGQRR